MFTTSSDYFPEAPPQGPLQSAWAREVQRRHVTAVLRTNGVSRSSGSRVADQRSFEQRLQPNQRRFADFSRFGFQRGDVPEEVVDDLRNYFDLVDAMRPPSGGTTLPSVQSVSDAEFRRLPETSAANAGTDECAICLQDIAPHERLKQLPCGHALHAKCLRRWLQRSRQCPCCRAPLAFNQPKPKPAAPPEQQQPQQQQPPQQAQQQPQQPPPQQPRREPPPRRRSATTPQLTPPPATAPNSRSGGSGGSRANRSPLARTRNGGAALRTSSRSGDGGAAPSSRGPSGTADGGLVLRHYTNPRSMRRPEGVPPDAELLVIRYPQGVARVWRAALSGGGEQG